MDSFPFIYVEGVWSDDVTAEYYSPGDRAFLAVYLGLEHFYK